MTLSLIAAAVSFVLTLLIGRFLIPELRKLKAGQEIREDGPTWHKSKAGTPTMGGIMFILGAGVTVFILGWSFMLEGVFWHLYVYLFALIFGLIGFVDDYRKVRQHQNEGLTARQKFILQLAAAVVIYFADSISKKQDRMQTFRYGIAPYAVLLIVLAALVGIEPHLSGAILIMGAGAVMMLVGGIHWRWVGLAMGAAGLLLYLVLGVIGYNASRIEMWHNPWLDPQGAGYQLRQSLITIGSGGLWGVGLGKSRQKFLYLPEEHNDFIFAIVCEELGLIGATVIMLLFAALILRGFWIALHARDRFGSLMVGGVMTLVGLQTFLNIGVVTGLLPTTGISLPFFSYGGTALSIQLAEMGIVLSVSRQMKPTKAG